MCVYAKVLKINTQSTALFLLATMLSSSLSSYLCVACSNVCVARVCAYALDHSHSFAFFSVKISQSFLFIASAAAVVFHPTRVVATCRCCMSLTTAKNVLMALGNHGITLARKIVIKSANWWIFSMLLLHFTKVSLTVVSIHQYVQ